MYQTHDCRGNNYYTAGSSIEKESTIKDVILAGVILLAAFAVPFGSICLYLAAHS